MIAEFIEQLNLPIAEEREDGLLGGLVAESPWPVLIRLVRPLPNGSIPPLLTNSTGVHMSPYILAYTYGHTIPGGRR